MSLQDDGLAQRNDTDSLDGGFEWVLVDERMPDASAMLASDTATARRIDVQAVVHAAWHLRQRNSPLALDLATRAQAIVGPEGLAPALAARLDLVRAEASWLNGEPAAALRLADDAAARFAPLAELSGLSDAAWLQAQLAGDEGRNEDHDRALELARRHAEGAGDRVRAMHATLARAFEDAVHDPGAADLRWRDTVEQALASGEPAWRPYALIFLGFLAFQRSNYVEAIRCYAQAQEAACRIGMLRRAIVCQLTVAASFANLHDKQQSLEWAQRALDLARAARWPGSIGTCLLTVGATLRELGRLQGAARVLDEALGALGAMSGSRNEALALNYRGMVHLDAGEAAAALRCFDLVAARARALALEEIAGYAHEGRARALLALGRLDDALVAADAALAVAQAQAAIDSQVDALMIAADVRTCRGERDGPQGAMALLLQALALARTVAQGLLAPELLDRLARCAADSGAYSQAYAYATEAAQARARTADEAAMQRALALEVKLDTERARAEAERQRQLALVESERARVLLQAHNTLERLAEAGHAITQPRSVQAVCAALQQHACDMLGVAQVRVTDMQMPPIGADGIDIRVSADGSSHDIVAVLSSAEGVQGVLQADGLPGARMGESERLVLRNLCAFGAVALGHARAFRALQDAHAQLAEASIVDPLTGMHNRRYLLQHIDADVEWSLRQWQSRIESGLGIAPDDADLVFLIGDLDEFKMLNDGFGHAAGDEVLRLLQSRLRPQIRASDHLVRWGGEEVLVVARGTARHDARALAERLRSAIADRPFVLDDGRVLNVTASFGWAPFPWDPRQLRAVPWTEVLKRADEALYRAKARGRNACVGQIADRETRWVEAG